MPDVMIIVAHPDDETLGAGGTISKHVLAMEPVHVRTFSDGVGARGDDVDRRARAHLNALSKLGVTTIAPHSPNLPDNEFDTVPLLKISKQIERWILQINAKEIIMYTHSLADLNQDHRRIAEAVLVATRPQPEFPVRAVYSMEIPSSTEYAFGRLGTFKPNLFVDITKTMQYKLEAWRCYEDEVREYPHARSEEAIKALAMHRGVSVGVEAAEAFEIIRETRR